MNHVTWVSLISVAKCFIFLCVYYHGVFSYGSANTVIDLILKKNNTRKVCYHNDYCLHTGSVLGIRMTCLRLQIIELH